MAKMLGGIWEKFVDFTVSSSKLGFSSSDYHKFWTWAQLEGYKIEKIEASSVWEAKFVVVSRPAVFAKVIFTDSENNR